MSIEIKTKPKPQNHLREAFAKFFEDPSRDKLHELIKGSGGEFRDLDFKAEWPSKAQVAKQVLGLGNIGGGVLVVGVEEQADGTLKPAGLKSLTDKADVTGWLKGIIPSGLLADVSVHDFEYPGGEYGAIQGLKFQVMFVAPDEDQLPFLPLKEAEKIVPGTIYVRRDGMVEAASHDEVQRILNRRIESGHSTKPQLDLKAHMEQLRVLYGQIEPTTRTGLGWLFENISNPAIFAGLGGRVEPNPLYPSESLEEFVSAQIDAKKGVIRRLLGTL
jgi:hypothetical protein